MDVRLIDPEPALYDDAYILAILYKMWHAYSFHNESADDFPPIY